MNFTQLEEGIYLPSVSSFEERLDSGGRGNDRVDEVPREQERLEFEVAVQQPCDSERDPKECRGRHIDRRR